MREVLMNALTLCEKYYNKKKMNHAIRVANYVYEDISKINLNNTNDVFADTAYAIALLHDLVEDTDATIEDVKDVIDDKSFIEAIILLTNNREDDTYEDYIKRIIESNNKYVFLVKKADLKDHLSQSDTLTDKLKEKYSPIIKYFL